MPMSRPEQEARRGMTGIFDRVLAIEVSGHIVVASAAAGALLDASPLA